MTAIQATEQAGMHSCFAALYDNSATAHPSLRMHPMNKLIDTTNLEATLAEFARQRDWDPFHTPRSLLLALTGEVGELVEIFQWMTDAQADVVMQTEKAEHVKQEVADVLLYLMRIAMVLKIDVNEAVRDKIALNAVKYPPLHD
jgi:NTP pyrophosphatase (non-canonical NTP hydrolase)